MPRRKAAPNTEYILKALSASERPLSAYELIEALRPQAALAPTTIYRALKKLISDGKAHRIESLNAFVACRHPRSASPAREHEGEVGFAICDRCGAIDEFVDPVIAKSVAADLSALAFLPRALTLEVHGLCASCRADKVSAET